MSDFKNGGWDNKYIISKRSGKPVDPDASYFVLRIDEDPHALVALEAYAKSVRDDNQQLSDDIRKRIGIEKLKKLKLSDLLRKVLKNECDIYLRWVRQRRKGSTYVGL